jgi:hypothetical protein
MPSPSLLIVSGLAMAALGIFKFRNPEWIRKNLYRNAPPSERFNRWLYTKFVSENTLVQLYRFTACPALVIAGCLLFAKGLQGV